MKRELIREAFKQIIQRANDMDPNTVQELLKPAPRLTDSFKVRVMKLVLILLFTLAALGAQAKNVPSACDSCKGMVQNFIDASKDKMKMAQLKISLSMLCVGTSHQSDCHKTLDKLDFIAYKLSPYLTDTTAVCSKVQMCGESKFSPLSRLAMLYLKKSQSAVKNDNIMKQEVCDECQESSQQLSQLFNDDFTTYAVKSTLQRLVCRSAGKAHKACNIFMANMVPEMMSEMRDILSEKQLFCGNMGLCIAKNSPFVQIENPKSSISDIWKSMGLVKTSKGEELMSCFECILSVDTLLEEFINKRQETANDIQTIVCEKVVGNWTDGCNDFVHMYMSTALYLTYNQFDGKGVCVDLHSCESNNDFSEIAQPERNKLGCENCGAVEKFFAQNHVSLHAHATSAFSRNVCQKLPTSLGTLCDHTAFRLSDKLFSRAAELAKSGVMCSQIC
uniref:Saposin B-type domain-containing protein n=2 Tax=Caenorhabditis japonica TaxID=281687 RepID=A0A8R1HUY3_CAEJA